MGRIMQSLCGGTEAIKYRRAVLTRMCAKPISTTRGKPLGAEPARLEASHWGQARATGGKTTVRARHTAAHGTMPSHPRALW